MSKVQRRDSSFVQEQNHEKRTYEIERALRMMAEIPAGPWPVGLSHDGIATNSGTRSFTTAASGTDLTSQVVTSGSAWRVVFEGVWMNNWEGSNLPQQPIYLELSSANPSYAIGGTTLTVSRDATTGRLIGRVTAGSGTQVDFTGRVRVYVQKAGAGLAGTMSMRLSGGLKIGSLITLADDGVVAFRTTGQVTSGLHVYNDYATFGNTLIRAEQTQTDTTGFYFYSAVNATGTRFYVRGDGQISYTGVISDERFKENVKSLTDPLRVINALRPVHFDWNDKAALIGHSHGFIAQEVQGVIKEAVEESELGKKGENPLTLNQTMIIPFLVGAVQILDAERVSRGDVDDLKAIINDTIIDIASVVDGAKGKLLVERYTERERLFAEARKPKKNSDATKGT